MVQKEYEAKMREILDREVNTDEDCILNCLFVLPPVFCVIEGQQENLDIFVHKNLYQS